MSLRTPALVVLAALAVASTADAQKAPRAPAGPGVIVATRPLGCAAFDPDGTKRGEFKEARIKWVGGRAAVSPDGRQLLLTVCKDDEVRLLVRPAVLARPEPARILFNRVDRELALREVRDVSGFALEPLWMPDGKSIILGIATSHWRTAYDTVRLDPDTGETTPLALPVGCRVLDVTRDGKTFLVEHRTGKGRAAKLGLTAAGAAEVRPLADLQVTAGTIVGRFSPDGKAVLFTDGDPVKKDAHKWELSHRPYRLDVATGKREPLAGFPENARAIGVAWSPDGKRVAYTWLRLYPHILAKDQLDTTPETQTHLIVAGADGRNPKTLASGRGNFIADWAYGELDWR
ncbi:PD40 domain-containing protein [bacterium]|nr:PD40 domain-containing protein [bacterium]